MRPREGSDNRTGYGPWNDIAQILNFEHGTYQVKIIDGPRFYIQETRKYEEGEHVLIQFESDRNPNPNIIYRVKLEQKWVCDEP